MSLRQRLCLLEFLSQSYHVVLQLELRGFAFEPEVFMLAALRLKLLCREPETFPQVHVVAFQLCVYLSKMLNLADLHSELFVLHKQLLVMPEQPFQLFIGKTRPLVFLIE